MTDADETFLQLLAEYWDTQCLLSGMPQLATMSKAQRKAFAWGMANCVAAIAPSGSEPGAFEEEMLPRVASKVFDARTLVATLGLHRIEEA